jgi:hypothetical protein
MEKQEGKIILSEQEYEELIIIKNNVEIIQKEAFNARFNAEKAEKELDFLQFKLKDHLKTRDNFMLGVLLLSVFMGGFGGYTMSANLNVRTEIFVILLVLATSISTAVMCSKKSSKKQKNDEEDYFNEGGNVKIYFPERGKICLLEKIILGIKYMQKIKSIST